MSKAWHPGPVAPSLDEMQEHGDSIDALRYVIDSGAIRWHDRAPQRTPNVFERLEAERDDYRKRASAAEYDVRCLRSQLAHTEALLAAERKRQTPTNGAAWLTSSLWKRVAALIHPDRHQGSADASEVMRIWLENRPK
jgi:hypothetical protein